MAISQIVQNSFSPDITLGKDFVLKPTITSPANNSTNVTDIQLFTASPYLSLYDISQANAEWEISTSPTFDYINVASTILGSNTEFQSNASSGLVTNTRHYIRVRYSDTSNNTSDYSNTVEFLTDPDFTVFIPVEFLVIAGGGGGGSNSTGGGGAGGYRSSVFGESSGGGGSAEPAFVTTLGNEYTVTIGAGGAGGPGGSSPGTSGGSPGSNSSFGSITSIGGGGAARNNPAGPPGYPGGSGGGAGLADTQGSGTPGQGYDGGGSSIISPFTGVGGGGGAGAIGLGYTGTFTVPGSTGGVGGNGVESNITGTPTYRGGGGGGSGDARGTAGGPGGLGGGGTGSAVPAVPGGAGTPNTGGGGGGASFGNGQPRSAGGAGGSGVVLLKYSPVYSISNPDAGLTLSTTTVGSNTVTTITAGTGNVIWSIA